MAVKIIEPYSADAEKLREFVCDGEPKSRTDTSRLSVERFGNVIVRISPSVIYADLLQAIESGVEDFITSDDNNDGYTELVSVALPALPTQLSVARRHYRPSALPPQSHRRTRWAYGTYPVICTNNLADYVAFGARPYPAVKYEGDLRDNTHVDHVVIAPSNTSRALRLFCGCIGYILGQIEHP